MFDMEPALNGVTETPEKIWSQNTGRATNGEATGDIVAIKRKLQVSYPPMNKEQKEQLEKAVSSAFFKVIYMGKEYTMYAGSPVYGLYNNLDGRGPFYSSVGVDLIEK